jgi:guanylate kinase
MAGAASGLLFVVTAPSGAGKTSLIDALIQKDPRLKLSISYTTRPPRSGETNGREYHFIDEGAFLAMLQAGEFLEHAEVHGFRYGTSQRIVRALLASGEDLILEIDWQGARQVRKLMPECVGIFILPPSVAELERRMRSRGKDSDAVIARRMAGAREELAHAPEFEYAIINKDFDEALQDLAGVIRAERVRSARVLERHSDLLQPED